MQEQEQEIIKLTTQAENPENYNPFLNAILEKTIQFVHMLDVQINVLATLTSAIFIFSVSQLISSGGWPFLVLTLFSALSAIVSLYALHPPNFMRKTNQKESLLYQGRILRLPTAQHYANELTATLNDPNQIVKQISREVYNINKYFYRPKRRLFKTSRNLLIYGIVITLIVHYLDTYI